MPLPVQTYPDIDEAMQKEVEQYAPVISDEYRLLLEQAYRAFAHSIETLRRNNASVGVVGESLPFLFGSMVSLFTVCAWPPEQSDDALRWAESLADTVPEHIRNAVTQKLAGRIERLAPPTPQ